MAENLFYQMRVKLRAEAAGLSAVSWESGQVILRFPSSSEDKESQRLPDLGPGIRGGKKAYWCSLGEDWQDQLLEILGRLNHK
jgi:transcription-repair coupling factor (superfamily II helicase)